MEANATFFFSPPLSLYGIAYPISKKLSLPLIQIAEATNKLRLGNYKTRSNAKATTIEVASISDSINSLAETLENQEILRNRLSTDIAHEIKTPLTTIRNTLEAFEDGILDVTPDKIRSLNEDIKRLSNLVDNLNNISKIEQANLNFKKGEFDLSEEIELITDIFSPLFEKKKIDFVMDINKGILVFMDKDKLKQIVGNILLNAYRYTNKNGKVVVSLKRAHNKIELKISDTGIGISTEDLPHIFERFYRAEQSRSRETGGTGVGLAIVKAYVEAHDGEVYVESALGKGSTFNIAFKLYP